MKTPASSYRSRTYQQGFTLIEVLVVVAIISILAMVATPFYQAYASRAKVSADIAVMGPLQTLVNEHYIIHNTWPVDNEGAGGQPPHAYFGKYINSVLVSDAAGPGSITLTYDNSLLKMLGGNNTLIYYPIVDAFGGVKTWECDAGSMDNRYRPTQCKM